MTDPDKFTLRRTELRFIPADRSRPTLVIKDAKVQLTTTIEQGDQVFSHTFDPADPDSLEKATNEMAAFVLSSLGEPS